MPDHNTFYLSILGLTLEKNHINVNIAAKHLLEKTFLSST